jgi:asparagine synthase (glutamine-hydrolysing)
LDEYFERFYELIHESVRMRLMSEVPLGVFLSGGMDSSFVVALMSGMVNSPIKTFSVGYETDYGTNEFEYARMVAKKYGTEHHELKIKSQDFFEFLPRLVWYLDEPIADPATIPLFFLSEYAKKWITVILSGEGADEILAGYYIYKKMLWVSRYQRLPYFIRENVLSKVTRSFAKKRNQKKYLEMSRLPLVERYHGVSNGFSIEMKESLFPWSKTSNNEVDALFKCYYQEVAGWSELNKMLYVDLRVWLPDDLLMKADKMTMAASMELRVPFLDHKLIEFAFSLPEKLKVNGNTTKYILRQISKKFIPAPIVKRVKKGFPVPLSEWLRKDLRLVAEEALLENGSASRDYFEPSVVREIIRKQIAGEDDLSQEIWNLLVFEFWHRGFVKQA